MNQVAALSLRFHGNFHSYQPFIVHAGSQVAHHLLPTSQTTAFYVSICIYSIPHILKFYQLSRVFLFYRMP